VFRAGESLMFSESQKQDVTCRLRIVARTRREIEPECTHDQNHLIRSLSRTPGASLHSNRLQRAQSLVAYAICAHRCKAPATELR